MNKMESKILVKERSIVIPGEKIAEGMDYLPGDGSSRDGDNVYSNRLGLLNLDGKIIKIIPLKGKYLPKRGDNIIGTVTDVSFSGWRVDFGWAFLGSIPLRDGSRDYIENGADLSKYYKAGDIVLGKITKVAGSKIIDISMNGPGLRKLIGGRIIDCNPVKVPRIIGKQGSMISLIKEHTNCSLFVGQNGKVWINCEDPEQERKVVDVIRMIEENAHLPGLTEKVSKFLEGKKK